MLHLAYLLLVLVSAISGFTSKALNRAYMASVRWHDFAEASRIEMLKARLDVYSSREERLALFTRS